MHTILVKVFKNISEEIEELDDFSQEEVSRSAYEHLSEFEKAALGFFSKKFLQSIGPLIHQRMLHWRLLEKLWKMALKEILL